MDEPEVAEARPVERDGELDAAPAEEEPAPEAEVIAVEPPTPPFHAAAVWAPLASTDVGDFDGDLSIVVSATESAATVSLEVRADVDGAIHERTFGPVTLQPGEDTTWSIAPADAYETIIGGLSTSLADRFDNAAAWNGVCEGSSC